MSLTSTILPTTISVVGFTDDFSARFDLAGFAGLAYGAAQEVLLICAAAGLAAPSKV